MAELDRAAIDNNLERLFGELRDRLLEASHQFATSEQHDWALAEHFFTASKSVDELCRNIVQSSSKPQPVRAAPVRSSEKNGAITSSDVADRTARRRSKKDYPKYLMRSDALIKVGLSRDRRTEYEHAVQKAEYDSIVTRLGELAGRRHFSADDVIAKVRCPSYQVYIVISLLKERGLLAVPRRGMYAFNRPKSFTIEGESLWNDLAEDQPENAHE